MRHLEAADLWIQQLVRSGRVTIQKINGKLNPPDLYTKFLSRNESIFHMNQLGFQLFDIQLSELGVKKQLALGEAELSPDTLDEQIENECASIFADIMA